MSLCRFELVQGSSAKFWEVSTDGKKLTIRYGRIGTAGQTLTKTFVSNQVAQNQALKLIAEKTAKGYRECVAA